MAFTKEQLATRKLFRKMYGTRTLNVVDYLMKGWDTQRIAEKFDMSRASVAATKANYTRGTYNRYFSV